MRLKSSLAVGFAAVSLVALAGCSSSGSSGADSATSAAAAQPSGGAPGDGGQPDRAAGFAKFRDCMQQHGVTMPSRGPDQGGPGQGGPGQGGPGQGGPGNGGPGGGGPGQGGFFGGQLPDGVTEQQMQDAMSACQSMMPGRIGGQMPDAQKSAIAAFTSCLSDHGVVLPSSNGGFPRVDQTDPKNAAAWTACAPLLPARPGGPGGPGGPNGRSAAPASPAA